MSLKRLYNVENIYYLSTRGFTFSVEKNLQLCPNFTNGRFNLINNGKSLVVQLKGIESLSGKTGHTHNLLLASLNEDENILMDFLGMNSKRIFLENVKNVYLEVEFFDE